jgi:S1-C subfamily serine protease
VSRARAALVCAAVAVAGCGQGEQRGDPVVVRVELEGATSATEVATGFAVAANRVVTVAHVLDPGRRLLVRAGGRTWRGRVVRRDERNDLALLAVSRFRLASAPAIQRIAADGGRLRILVRRGGRTAHLRARLVRPVQATLHTPNSPARTRPALQLDAHVALGDSGAPVVDMNGRIAGVVFARASNGSPTAYAVDAVAVQKLLD